MSDRLEGVVRKGKPSRKQTWSYAPVVAAASAPRAREYTPTRSVVCHRAQSMALKPDPLSSTVGNGVRNASA